MIEWTIPRESFNTYIINIVRKGEGLVNIEPIKINVQKGSLKKDALKCGIYEVQLTNSSSLLFKQAMEIMPNSESYWIVYSQLWTSTYDIT